LSGAEGKGKEMGESRRTEDLEGKISLGKRLVEDRAREYMHQCDIDSRRTQVGWYRKPGQLSTNPYIFMISTGGTPEQCTFSEEELASFAAGNREIDARLRALVNELKENTTSDTC
jgi:hypothetical protein